MMLVCVWSTLKSQRWTWPGFDGSDDEWSLPRAQHKTLGTGHSADAAETCYEFYEFGNWECP